MSWDVAGSNLLLYLLLKIINDCSIDSNCIRMKIPMDKIIIILPHTY